MMAMPRRLVVVLAMFATALGNAPSAVAEPYEIPARWVESEGMLSPLGVDFSFIHIERVPGLGVVAYGDRLLLRIDDGENPYVTLGVAGKRFADEMVTYSSVAPLADGSRLMCAAHVSGDTKSFRRETTLERVDVTEGNIMPFPLPPPSDGAAAWWTIGLFAGSGGKLLAYASQAAAISQPVISAPLAPALEQRVFALDDGRWTPLPSLSPGLFTVSDACLAGGSLFAVGTSIRRDADDEVVSRRGGAAELDGDTWIVADLPPPSSATVWGMDMVACGSDREAAAAVGSTAASTDSAGRRALLGPSALYTFDGEHWTEIREHPGAPSVGDSDYARVSTIAVAPDRSLWVAYERADDPQRELYRYAGGKWQAFPLPPVPTVSHYVIRGIAFTDDGKGWAISNLEGAAEHPESRGILLHFDGSAWEQRPWTWSPLKQHWFGLLGNLS